MDGPLETFLLTASRCGRPRPRRSDSRSILTYITHDLPPTYNISSRQLLHQSYTFKPFLSTASRCGCPRPRRSDSRSILTYITHDLPPTYNISSRQLLHQSYTFKPFLSTASRCGCPRPRRSDSRSILTYITHDLPPTYISSRQLLHQSYTFAVVHNILQDCSYTSLYCNKLNIFLKTLYIHVHTLENIVGAVHTNVPTVAVTGQESVPSPPNLPPFATNMHEFS